MNHRYQVRGIPDPDFNPREPEDEWPEVYVVIDTWCSDLWEGPPAQNREDAETEAEILNAQEW